MQIAELHDWTFIRLSYVQGTCVQQAIVATGHVYNLPAVIDGSLHLTMRPSEVEPNLSEVRTADATYRLIGSNRPVLDWSPSRYEWTWHEANYGIHLLAEMTNVEPFPAVFHNVIRDRASRDIYVAQLGLMRLIEIAGDIDNGVTLASQSAGLMSPEALGRIVARTAEVELAITLALRGRDMLAAELGGLVPAVGWPGFPPALVLPDGGQKYFARSLIEISERANLILSYLPETLGPWARCAWFVSNNPNTSNLVTPIYLAEVGEIDAAIEAARLFPMIAK